MANASKYHYFGVVINAPKESPQIVEDLRAFEQLLQECKEYQFLATIIHDRDIMDNNQPKRPHLHAFVDFGRDNDKTINQALKSLAESLKIAKEQISIEGTYTDILLVQYLTHQNHPNKAQYRADEIKTNNRERLETILSTNYQPPVDTDKLIEEALFECRTLTDLINKVGVKDATKYRTTFNQIKDEQNANIEGLAKRLDERTDDCNCLYLMLLKIVREIEAKALTDEDLKEANELIDLMDFYRQID